MPDLTRVVAAVIRHDDQFLVCQRPLHKRHGGLWEFPGGKCEPGETDSDALRRELLEELSVSVTIVGKELTAFADIGAEFLVVFIEAEIDGVPHALEHTALAWGAPQALIRMDLAPSDRQFVETLLSGI